MLYAAVDENDFERVKSFLISGDNPNVLDRWSGIRPIQRCVELRNLPMARLLLENGAMPNMQSYPPFPAWTISIPLITAVQMQNLDMADLLLAFGADVHASDYYEDMSIHIAVSCGNIDLVRLLLHAGADSSEPKMSNEMRDALFIAVENGNLEMVDLLYEEGSAVSSIFDKIGGNALDELELNISLGFPDVYAVMKSKVNWIEMVREQSFQGNYKYFYNEFSRGIIPPIAQLVPLLPEGGIQEIQSWAKMEISCYALFYHGECNSELRRLTDAPGPISEKICEYLIFPSKTRAYIRNSKYW